MCVVLKKCGSGELSGCGLLGRKITSETELNGGTVISLAAID